MDILGHRISDHMVQVPLPGDAIANGCVEDGKLAVGQNRDQGMSSATWAPRMGQGWWNYYGEHFRPSELYHGLQNHRETDRRHDLSELAFLAVESC